MNRVIFLAIFGILIAGCKSTTDLAKRLSKDAYYQLRWNPFDRDSLSSAKNKMRISKAFNNKEPWYLMAESELKLTEGYQIGDWFYSSSFINGSVNEAFDLAKRAYQSDTLNSYSCSHLAYLFIILEDRQSASIYLKKSYELDPTNFYSYFFLGVMYSKYNDPESAIKYFERSKLYSWNQYQKMSILGQEADAYEILNDYKKQEALLLEILKADPSNAYNYENYGHFLHSQKRLDEAIQAYQKALEIKEYPNIITLLNEVTRERDSVSIHTN